MFSYDTIFTALEDEMKATDYIQIHGGTGKNDLRPLLDSWFDEAEKYIKELAASQSTAKPQELPLLVELIGKSKMELGGLYTRRIAKIVAIASCNADGGNIETDHMTTFEKALYDNLLATLSAHRNRFRMRFFD